MKGHARIMVFVLLVGLLVMTGCEKRYTGSESDTIENTETQIVTETETESETDPATIRETVEADKVKESSTQDMKDFESSLGYRVIYDKELFTYNRTGDYDEIALKGQTFSSKPLVFFAAMKIDNDDVQYITDEIFTASAQETVIGKGDYKALCQPTAESVADGKRLIHHNQYLVQLMNGDALLFETQWYEEEGGVTEGELLSAMLDSIIIDLPVQGQIAESDLPESELPESEVPQSETEEQTENN